MDRNLNRFVEELQVVNLRLRQQLELAEAQLPAVNALIDQLTRLDLANGVIVLGDVIYQRPYTPGQGPTDSGQLYQTAVKIPDGLGLVLWGQRGLLSCESDTG